MSETHYVSFEGGEVQSVDHEHFENVLTEWVNGKPYLRRGFEEHTEQEARKLNGRLFGAPDPRVEQLRTDEEIAREFERRQLIAQMRRMEGEL